MQQITQRLREYFKGISFFSWWKAHLWIVLTVPALLWWKESLVFIILLSLFANYESSMAEYKADKVKEENAKDNNTKD